MRKTWILAWALTPALFVAWHYGPGQNQLARDQAGELLLKAQAAAGREEWADAAAAYQAALDALPEEAQAQRQRVRLAQAAANVQAGEVLAGQEQLEQLLAELQEDAPAEPALVDSARHELATAGYYAAWLMRLEGATADEWKPEAERARQQFRLLAEQTVTAGTPQAQVESSQRNLESVIRLEEMDLSELSARPLPKNCPCNCKNLCQRKRKQCQSQARANEQQNKSEGKPEDVRKEIKGGREAGLNELHGRGS